MGEAEDRDVVMRLRRLEGQIRGVQRMVEADRSCDEVVTQLLAVRAAIDRVGLLVLGRQVELCLGESGDPRSVETLRTALRHITRLGNPTAED